MDTIDKKIQEIMKNASEVIAVNNEIHAQCIAMKNQLNDSQAMLDAFLKKNKIIIKNNPKKSQEIEEEIKKEINDNIKANSAESIIKNKKIMALKANFIKD